MVPLIRLLVTGSACLLTLFLIQMRPHRRPPPSAVADATSCIIMPDGSQVGGGCDGKPAYTLDPGCYVSQGDSRWSDSRLIQHMVDRIQAGGCPNNTVTLDGGHYELDGPIIAREGTTVNIVGSGSDRTTLGVKGR